MQSFNQQELLERLNQPEWRNFKPTRARNKAPNDIIGSWQELGYPTPEIINTKAAKSFELVVREVGESRRVAGQLKQWRRKAQDDLEALEHYVRDRKENWLKSNYISSSAPTTIPVLVLEGTSA